MTCQGCGNDHPYRTRAWVEDGKIQEVCDRCGATGSSTTLPDVYWPGHPHHNPQLVDNQGKPILLTSRGHKAQVLKEKGLIEGGDRYHGAPIAPSGHWKDVLRTSHQ